MICFNQIRWLQSGNLKTKAPKVLSKKVWKDAKSKELRISETRGNEK